MRGKIRKSAVMLSVIAWLLAMTLATPTVSAQDTVLAVSCAIDPKLTAGSTFSVDITVDDVVAMYGYEFILRYDPNVLSATGFTGLAPMTDTEKVYIGGDYIAADASFPGVEWFGLTTSEPVPIGTISFKVVGSGVSELELWYTVVVDVYGEVIDHTAKSGTFSNIWTEPYTVSVALDTGFVESRHFKIAKEEDIYQTLTGQIKNIGNVTTQARVNFRIFDAMGAKIADLTTEEVYITPHATLRLSRDLDVTGLELKPATYLVEVRVQYIGFCTGWTTGLKGSPDAARTTMELTFKLSEE